MFFSSFLALLYSHCGSLCLQTCSSLVFLLQLNPRRSCCLFLLKGHRLVLEYNIWNKKKKIQMETLRVGNRYSIPSGSQGCINVFYIKYSFPVLVLSPAFCRYIKNIFKNLRFLIQFNLHSEKEKKSVQNSPEALRQKNHPSSSFLHFSTKCRG